MEPQPASGETGPLPALRFHTGQAAEWVIGQPDFTSRLSAHTREGLGRVVYGNPAVVEGRLYLSDCYNGRLLGFNAPPAVNGAAADFVVQGTELPWAVAADGGRLFICEPHSRRIRVLEQIPFSDATAGMHCWSPGLNSPRGVAACGGKLLVADTENHRVLVWNSMPRFGTPPDIVLGQYNLAETSFDGGLDGPRSNTLCAPSGVWTDGTRVVVLDSGHNRALIWNRFPTTFGAAPDLILGQPYRESIEDNFGGVPTAATMRHPDGGVCVRGDQLFVTDSWNNRVLIWNRWPAASGQPADVVLGQPDFQSTGAAITATGMKDPAGLAVWESYLVVGDSANNRYLLFNGAS